MANVTDLIQFIENQFIENSKTYNTQSQWESKLSRSVPNWRNIIADPKNWDLIKEVTLIRSGEHLFRCFIEVGGVELAKSFFHSDVSDQRLAARAWLTNHAPIDSSLWSALDRSMKDHLLEKRFRSGPLGEPFEMLERYEFEIHRLIRDIDRGDLPYAIFPLQQTLELGYVPPPQVKKLRSVIAEAGDQVYLSRIDGMISRREEACKVAFQQQRRIPYTPNSNETELIARVMEITRESGYLPTALPPIFVSYETPPIFIAYPELEEEDDEYQIRRNRDQRRDEEQIPRNRERRKPETISIEELLGVYQSQHQQIVIYERGVKWSTHRHQLDAEWLRTVVLIHEIGHWITHVLPKPGVPTWSTDLFALSEADLKEGWAQLITWWIADQVGGPFKETFERLNQRQSRPYHVFEQFKDEPIDKVMESLEKLRLLLYPARLQDWKEALS